MQHSLIEKLKIKKQDLLKDGFEIIGVFGSYAKGTQKENSDIDILYDIKPSFMEKYRGFEAFSRLKEIKDELKEELHKKIDLATIDNHSKTFQEYALKDIIYV